MGKPKEILLGEESGIGIEYIKSRKKLNIWGWYDSTVGIEGASISLKEFCEKLGITEKGIEEAS